MLLVGSGLLMIIGMGKLAASLFMLTIVLAAVPALLAPLFDAMPTWLLIVVMTAVGVSAAFAALGFVFRFLFGKGVGTIVLGQLIADLISAIIKRFGQAIWWAARSLSLWIWRSVHALFNR